MPYCGAHLLLQRARAQLDTETETARNADCRPGPEEAGGGRRVAMVVKLGAGAGISVFVKKRHDDVKFVLCTI